MNAIKISWEKPPLKEALSRARAFCLEPHDPPISRSEIYSVYRMAKAPGSNIFFRCRFDTSK